MDRNKYIEHIKEKIQTLFQQDIWTEENLNQIVRPTDSYSRTQVIWIMSDLVKEGKFLDAAMRVAEIYKDDADPLPNSDEDGKIRKNEDISYIVTVRGSLPYLLEKIVARLDTDYYPRVLNVTEQLLNDPNLYVRAHAMVALSSMAMNVYATTRHDGTPFDFKDEDKAKVVRLAFKSLDENHDYPRVLEHLTHVFEKLRRLNAHDAKRMLEGLVYQNIEQKIYNPSYVLESVAPLLIYYAEFRTQLPDGFDSGFFVKLLETVLETAPPELKSTIIWHLWKVIEENNEYLPKLSKYFKYLFEGNFQLQTVGQMEILLEQVFLVDPDLCIDLFKKFVAYIMKRTDRETIWLLSVQDLLAKIAESRPDNFSECLDLLFLAWRQGNTYIGDYNNIFKAYSFAPETNKTTLREKTLAVFSQMHRIRPEVQESYDD